MSDAVFMPSFKTQGDKRVPSFDKNLFGPYAHVHVHTLCNVRYVVVDRDYAIAKSCNTRKGHSS